MGFDGIYKVYLHKNDTYEELALYNKDGKQFYGIFPSRDGMLNQLLLGYNRHGYEFDPIDSLRGLPHWYIDILKEEHSDWFDDQDGWTYNNEDGTYYDYTELRGWSQGNICEHVDWNDDFFDYGNENVRIEDMPKRNALKDFMNSVDIILEVYGIYHPCPGEVIIICEMSY